MLNFTSLTGSFLFSFKYKYKHWRLLPACPRYINLSFTYACNSRCLMCDNWKRYQDDPQKAKEELTIKDFERFFDENRYCLSDLKHIGISGGEPFLRPDLVELVKLIRQKLPWVSVGIQTNGFLTEKIKEKLQEILRFYPEITLAVSLDGIGKTHDKIRGVKSAFEKVIETIKIARKLKIKEITAGMTVVKDNLKEIAAVRRLLAEKGIKFSCYPADEGEYYGNFGEKITLSSTEKKAMADQLELCRGDYFHDNLRRLLLGQTKRTLPCYSGWTSLVIDPYGEVRPCVLRFESFGNIRKQSLEKILTSEKAKQIRQKIKKCSCWNICEVTTSAVVDPWDVVKWFFLHADRKEFLKEIFKFLPF